MLAQCQCVPQDAQNFQKGIGMQQVYQTPSKESTSKDYILCVFRWQLLANALNAHQRDDTI